MAEQAVIPSLSSSDPAQNGIANGNIDAMITTIDKAGRLVIPKPLRDAMGLKPGSKIDLAFTDGRIVIEYAPVEWRIEIMNGFPVLRSDRDPDSPPITDEMIRETLEAVRDEGL